MSNHFFQTQSRDAQPTVLADCTFSSKPLKDSIKEHKDSKFSLDELAHSREEHRKTANELILAKSRNKELKREMALLERRVMQRDRELSDLESQLGHGSRKILETDMNIPRHVVQSSLDENAFNGKSLGYLIDYENSIKKLASQNKGLNREVERLSEKLKKFEDDNAKGYHQTIQELGNKLKGAEISQENATKENKQLKELVEKLSDNANNFAKENRNLRKSYEELKNRYDFLEMSVSSIKGDQSSESVATSDTSGSNASNSKKSIQKDVKWNFEGTDLTLQAVEAGVEVQGEEYKKIVFEIMDLYHIKNPGEIVPAIRKMEKVVKLAPKLKKVLSEVAELVIPAVGNSQVKGEIELIIPSIKKVLKERDDIDLLNCFRSKLIEVLKLEKECSNIEIVKIVDNLNSMSTQYTANNMLSDENKDGFECNLLSAQFTNIFGSEPSTAIFRQISKQLEHFKHFIAGIKNKMKLEADMKTDACLNHLLKILEARAKDKECREIVHQLQKQFGCGVDLLVYTIERLLLEKKKEKTNDCYNY